jgi:hypothetical protein
VLRGRDRGRQVAAAPMACDSSMMMSRMIEDQEHLVVPKKL